MSQVWFILITFIACTALVGIISSKIVSSDDQKTAKGYFLAGDSLTGFFIAGSMLLTNISAENIVGLSGQSYGFNMSGMGWESAAVIPTVIMALIFLPMYLRKGYTTLPQFMEDRYGTSVRRLVSILFLVGYIIVGIPVTLYAGSIAFVQMFNIPELFGISTQTAITIMIIIIGIIGACYAVFGGLKAVAVSDTINGILLVLGAGIVPVFALFALGKTSGGGFTAGINQLLTSHPEKLSAIGGPKDPVPFACIFTGIILANLFYWGTNQVLIQRTLGAKNLTEGQKGVLWSGFLKLLIPIFLIIPGIIAFHLVPGLKNSDYAYPTLVAKVVPWPLLGIFCAALMGAIISTYDSFLNSAATIFMVDVYKPIINPNIEESSMVKKAKIVSTICAVFAMIVSPFVGTMSTGLYNFGRSFTGFYNIPIITLVLVGMFSKRGSALGALVAAAWHIVFYSGYKFWFKSFHNPFFDALCKINYIHIFAISFLVMLVIFIICAKIAPNTKEYNRASVSRSDNYDMTPWPCRKQMAVWLISVLVYEYIVFSPIGIATKNRNGAFLACVTAALVIESIILYLIGKKKSTNIKQEAKTN